MLELKSHLHSTKFPHHHQSPTFDWLVCFESIKSSGWNSDWCCGESNIMDISPLQQRSLSLSKRRETQHEWHIHWLKTTMPELKSSSTLQKVSPSMESICRKGETCGLGNKPTPATESICRPPPPLSLAPENGPRWLTVLHVFLTQSPASSSFNSETTASTCVNCWNWRI